MPSAKITMQLRNETKGALRYEGIGDDSPDNPMYLLGSLYLRKAGVMHWFTKAAKDHPQRITVTVEVA